MQPRDYLLLAKRWAWLLGVGILIGLIGGAIYSLVQKPVYQATTKVMVLGAPQSSLSDILNQNTELLSQTFTELLVTRPVLEATSERLGYYISSSQVRVQQVRGAQLIQIIAEDSDPQKAAEIANTLVTVFLEQNAKIQSGRFSASEESLQAQIQQVEAQIADLQKQLAQTSEQSSEKRLQDVTNIISGIQTEINQLQADIVRLESDHETVLGVNALGQPARVTPTLTVDQQIELTQKRSRLDELKSLLNIYQQIYVSLSFSPANQSGQNSTNNQLQAALVLYQQIYANLLSNYEAIRLARLQSTPEVVQVEGAQVPSHPVRPQTTTNILLGGILGLLLAGGIVFLLEYLDDSIRNGEAVTKNLDLPVLGYISEMNGKLPKEAYPPHVVAQPRSPVTEAFRSIRTNLEFVEIDRPLKTLLIGSPSPDEGKTTVAVNLAIVMAQAGSRVLLMDTDLRQPQVHERLRLPNRLGLSDVLREHSNLDESLHHLTTEGIDVLTSGTLPPNPAEVLSSERMANLLSEVAMRYDKVILDGPPFLISDAIVLASRVDGVLLVLRARSTSQSVALEVLEQLDRVKARVVGAVLNRVQDSISNHYYHNLKSYAYIAKETDELTLLED
ncbi:polysaccharide biosynthesis tyrosine autokinase [Thermanaerothrix sp.]|uniref:polysaccharide biosynthesis tyrosine autokinase n=1 Tax=Thermanaerothrix sp. TaxID=2972675 RepID=UPI003C7C8A50